MNVVNNIVDLVFEGRDDDTESNKENGDIVRSRDITASVGPALQELSLNVKQHDDDTTSINSLTSSHASSIKSALAQEKAVLSKALHGVVSVTKTAVDSLLGRPKSPQSQYASSLEVLAAFETLAPTIKEELKNEALHPEIAREAVVTAENAISEEERAFQVERKIFCRSSFAKFIGVDESEVVEDDIPIIACGGSGGGLKAMIGTTGFLRALEADGLYDSVFYIAGVSGSCWTLSNLFRESVGTSPRKLVELFEKTLCNLPIDPYHIQSTLAKDPVVRVHRIFGGLVVKRLNGLPRGVVDIYSALIQSHFFSTEEGEWSRDDFKLSRQQRFMAGGSAPCPIHTTIRHERPWLDRVDPNATQAQGQEGYDAQVHASADEMTSSVRSGDAHWQWFELNPFDFGCDELKAWAPTWSFGRRFENGKSVDRSPEQNFTLQVGMVASAMTAPLQTTAETLQRTDPKSWFASRIRERAIKLLAPDASPTVKQALAMHPFHSAFNYNLYYKLVPSEKPGLVHSPRIQLIDAGADNNQPLAPFVRRGRNVDIVFVFDSSEDVERNVVTKDLAAFAARRGLSLARTSPEPPPQISPSPPNAMPKPPVPCSIKYKDRYCQTFLASATAPRDSFGAKGEPLAESDMVLLYMPMINNETMEARGFSPSNYSFGQLQYKKEEVANMVQCAMINYSIARDRIRDTVKSVWEKKRAARLAA